MLRRASWLFALALLLIGGGAVYAQEPGAKSSDAKPGDATRLDELAKDLGVLKKQAEETAVLLRKMTDQLDRMTEVTQQTQKNANELKALRDRLERAELDLARIKADAGARRSFGYDPPATQLGRGTIRLENTYSMPMTVLVGGVAYTIQPNETRYVEHGAGSFTYEVPGVQAPVVRTLAAGETFVVRIHTR